MDIISESWKNLIKLFFPHFSNYKFLLVFSTFFIFIGIWKVFFWKKGKLIFMKHILLVFKLRVGWGKGIISVKCRTKMEEGSSDRSSNRTLRELRDSSRSSKFIKKLPKKLATKITIHHPPRKSRLKPSPIKPYLLTSL